MSVDLIQYAGLAQSILQGSTPYSSAKRAISSLFAAQTNLSRFEHLCLRLTVIDSYYSTNMSKRYYGIEDIGLALQRIGPADDDITQFFLDYITNPPSSSEANAFFSAVYGINKSGDRSKRAQSLISKYGYFQTVYRFPIFDTLARKSYAKLSRLYPDQIRRCRKLDDIQEFFQCLRELNKTIDSYDKMDNLLWLMGKVAEGNLSLIINRDKYVALTVHCGQKLSLPLLQNLAANGSTARGILGEDLCAFISFVGNLDTANG